MTFVAFIAHGRGPLEKISMKLVTIKEISDFLSVKESTLYSWASKGLIPSHKLNGLLRFDMEEIEEWITKPREITKVPKGMGIPSKPVYVDAIIKKTIDDVTGKKL